MNEDRLYFSQPYNWIGAEEEIATKEEMFQENVMPYESQNYIYNRFQPNCSNFEPVNNDISRYDFNRGTLFPQADTKNYLTSFKSRQTYDRSRDNSGKSPLLKKMLQAPMGVSLEEIARPDAYLSNWTNTQYTMPNDNIINDDNSDTLTANSEGNNMDTWEDYRYNNGFIPTNIYLQKSIQGMDFTFPELLQYQNNASINVQESCRSWLASTMNPSNDVIDKKDENLFSVCYEDGQLQYQQSKIDLSFLTHHDPLDNQEAVFTDSQGNPCSSYYAHDMTENFTYSGQNGPENNTFVLPDQQPFINQDTPMNFVDCENQYNYEFQYDSNDIDGVTYTVLDDNKGIKNSIVSQNETTSSPMPTLNQTNEAQTENNAETIESYWPSWISNSEKKSRNLEILLNIQSKTEVDLIREEQLQSIYCCKTPIMSEKVNSINLSLQSQSSGIPAVNRKHNFKSHALLFETVALSNSNLEPEQTVIRETINDVTTTEMEMNVCLGENNDFNYFFVQDYQECNLETENGEVTATILMPINDSD